MRLGLLAWLIPVGALVQTYNGVLDGNVCTAVVPTDTTNITLLAPLNANTGNIGIDQLTFQTAGDGYTYSGSVLINGVAGTYNTQCCTSNGCFAEAVAINPFPECGLTWCGQENQWVYLDFTGTSIASTGVPQNTSATITFTNPMSMVQDANGNPMYAISYTLLVPPTSSPTQTASITPSASVTGSATLSVSPSPSISDSVTQSPSQTSSITQTISQTPSETPSNTRTGSVTGSISSTSSISPSGTRSQSLPPSSTPSPTISPSGICYSVSTQYGSIISLSSGWILVATGINVTQAYGSGYISMGTFAGCSTVGATCRCSYTQGSTVAGCYGKRNSYITYSYGSTTGITYTNESPTCSYNFLGTIGIPPSPIQSSSVSRIPSQSLSISASFTSSRSPTKSSDTSSSQTPSSTLSVSIIPSSTATNTPSLSPSKSLSPTRTPSLSESRTQPFSRSLTLTASGSLVTSLTSTPLFYCIPYPSISSTSNATLTPTPQYFMTRYPSNGTASASTSPFFMMIPYPSSSPAAINSTVYDPPADVVGLAVGGTAIAALGMGTAFLLYQYLKPQNKSQEKEQSIILIEEVEQVVVQPEDGLAHICVNPSELEEIKQLLIAHNKAFLIKKKS